MFLDEAVVEFSSGRGGAGAVSFHREKFVPRGGPDGADGGRGGSVILMADRSKRTLYDFKFQPAFKAEDGADAITHKKGKSGKSITVKVPVGTVVSDAETGEILADLAFDGAKFEICRGGRGGFGNLHYVSSVRQVPKIAQKGEPGQTVRARLELKLMADIGLVGLPNAGKSTLIAAISAAKPKIANYPFTTIVPNLGVVSVRDSTFTVADLPGLIEGASEGHGLGHQFLRHAERTAALVHLIEVAPMEQTDPLDNYRLIESELAKYSDGLAGRPRIACLSKIDVLPSDEVEFLQERFLAFGIETMAISAATGQGVQALLDRMSALVEEAAQRPPVPVLLPIAAKREDESFWDVLRTEDGLEVVGKRIEKLIAMTDLENEDAVHHLHRTLERIGVLDKLREMGVQEGDEVVLGDFVFTFEEDR